MGLVVAQFWKGSNDPASSTSIAVSGFQAGDLCVVLTGCFKTSAVNILAPTDDAGNVYTARVSTTWDATFLSLEGLADCVVTTPPTLVTANMDVVGAIDAVVLRIVGNLKSPFAEAYAKKQTSANPVTHAVGVQPGDIVIVAATTDGSGFLTAANQWSVLQFGDKSYRVFPTEQSVTHQWSNDVGAEDTSMVIGAYRPAASRSDIAPIIGGHGAR